MLLLMIICAPIRCLGRACGCVEPLPVAGEDEEAAGGAGGAGGAPL